MRRVREENRAGEDDRNQEGKEKRQHCTMPCAMPEYLVMRSHDPIWGRHDPLVTRCLPRREERIPQATFHRRGSRTSMKLTDQEEG